MSHEQKIRSIIRRNSIKKKEREKIAKMSKSQRNKLFFGGY